VDASDESTVTLNGTTVSELRDKSGNNRHLAQATAANQPEYTQTLNARKVISSTDGARFLGVAFSYTATQQTWFAVAQKTNSGNSNFRIATQRFSFSDFNVSGGYVPLYGAGTFFGSAISGSSGAVTANDLLSPTVVISRHTGAAVTNRANGVNSASASHTLNRSFDAIRILSHTINGGFIGLIGEVIFYSRHLSDKEVSSVENYLAAKWGITVAAPPLPAAPSLWKVETLRPSYHWST
jgi:hypothetical protein